ncbi:hypothetical protein CPT_Shaeky_045 [Streptomyces phage Shaeky]|uniref:Uncharacterized protein n=1 Tax=Streptomyces phage Shaeky TaxID=2767586 RepID=A0A873WL79_9CAUD|nr:hypothetical protein CPT_Shaeky_045 [Streptomyces phage Shaeky]
MTNALNKVHRYNCERCADEGGFEICHASTDALIGWEPCGECPPVPPVWKDMRGPNGWGYESYWKRTPAELAAEYACPF